VKDWETWRYLTGLHYLSDHYKPGGNVLILDSRSSREVRFKEWRGIVSSLVDRTDKYLYAAIQFDGAPDILCVSIFRDINAQIIVETLEDHMAQIKALTIY